MRAWAVVRFIFWAIFGSKAGWGGIAVVVFEILWRVLSTWQTMDFLLQGRMMPLADILNSIWGTLALVGLGFLLMGKAVYDRWPESQPTELEAQERWRRQETLDTYLNLMQQWLEDKNSPLLKSGLGDQRRKLARTQTRWVLKRLDPNGKRDVLEFLWEHKLIKRNGSILHPIVRLSHADLSNAHLANIALYGSNLDGIDLSDADLSGATLCWFASVDNNPDLLWPMEPTRLSNAYLIGAVLRGTTLAGCYLVGADFNGAVLDGADLSCADLQEACNLTQEQINRAFGTYQQNRLPDTKLPDHLEVPEAWKKLLSQQIAEKEASSN